MITQFKVFESIDIPQEDDYVYFVIPDLKYPDGTHNRDSVSGFGKIRHYIPKSNWQYFVDDVNHIPDVKPILTDYTFDDGLNNTEHGEYVKKDEIKYWGKTLKDVQRKMSEDRFDL